jgi:hypothetical protein
VTIAARVEFGGDELVGFGDASFEIAGCRMHDAESARSTVVIRA